MWCTFGARPVPVEPSLLPLARDSVSEASPEPVLWCETLTGISAKALRNLFENIEFTGRLKGDPSGKSCPEPV